jgi:aryl-alcohol dehydrogenase-like predicted oxidoreductase
MEKRQFGKTDMQVSVLGFGGAEIGFERAAIEVVSRLLASALDAGLNVIDTAECYLASEELIGEAVSGRRNEFYLFTKCGHPEHPGVGDWRPESLLGTITRSLTRLNTDRVDLIHLHSCSEEELRKGDVIAALQKAREKGYTRYIGYSGDGRAARYAVACGAFDSLQTSVSIADQESIDMTLPLARESQMGVIAKRPIANAAWRYAQTPAVDYHRPYWERLRTLDYDFLKGDPQQAVSIALRFTLSIPGVHTAIVGTKNPNRWHENAELLKSGRIPEQQVEAIRARWRATATPAWTGQT